MGTGRQSDFRVSSYWKHALGSVVHRALEMGGGDFDFHLGRAVFVEESRSLLAGFVKALRRSADFQSAVSRNCLLPGGRNFQTAQAFSRPAECNSAIRPIENLRYGAFLALMCTLVLSGCDKNSPASSPPSTNAAAIQSQPPANSQFNLTNAASARTPMYTYEVINIFPHDPSAFTQGLLYLNGALFESTGLNGQSTLRQVDLQTGKVRLQVPMRYEYFAEGLAVLDNKIFQLTWTNGKAFVYDLQSFKLQN